MLCCTLYGVQKVEGSPFLSFPFLTAVTCQFRVAILCVLSEVRSLRELRLHGLPLSPYTATQIGAAAPGLAKLCLSGACTSHASLQSGLVSLLCATPELEDLTMLNLTAAPVSYADDGGSVLAAWKALLGKAALRSLYLHFSDRGDLAGEPAGLFASNLATLTQLHSLSLDFSNAQSSPLPTALPAICTALTNLRSLSFSVTTPPNDLLRHLTLLPHLEVLSVRGWNGTSVFHVDGIQGVTFLPQLTALTSLSLAGPLSPSSIEHAVSDSLEGTWKLPPRLRVLRLSKPLRLAHLAAMDPPPSLCSVRLSPEPMQLPDSGQLAAHYLTQVGPRLLAWGMDPLALDLSSCHDHHLWFPALASLQLRGLKLCGAKLWQLESEALAEAVGSTLQELTLESCEASLLHIVPGLLRMRLLRTVLVSGLTEPDPAPIDRVRRGRTLREAAFHRLIREGPAAALAQQRGRAAQSVAAMRGTAAVEGIAMRGAAAVEGAAPDPEAVAEAVVASRQDDDSASTDMETDMEATLFADYAETDAERVAAAADQASAGVVRDFLDGMYHRQVYRENAQSMLEGVLTVLLSRGINVRLKDHSKWIRDASRVVTQRIANQAVGSGWGSL